MLSDILEKVNEMQLGAICQHKEMANLFDFMGLHGFKRIHKHQALIEYKENLKFNSWVINHTEMLIQEKYSTKQDLIPSDWYAKKSDVINDKIIVDKSTELFNLYEKNLISEMQLYKKSSKDLIEEDEIEAALKVNQFILRVGDELKRCRRMMQVIRNSGGSSAVLVLAQPRVHEKIKSKMKKHNC